MTRALVPLAPGVEEMEAVIIIDTLRRAGWEVTVAGIEPGPVTASRGVRLLPDISWEETDPDSHDLLVLPGGGPGTERLRVHKGVLDTIRSFNDAQKPIAAVCAGPLVLKEAGILNGRRFTCHPSVNDQFKEQTTDNKQVVEDGNLITSQGPGTSFDFALTLIARIEGVETAEKIASAMVHSFPPLQAHPS